ncbi:MAG: lipid A export permease/ATP-binding protein MsbA [Alphaproteobacteria bacterium]
MTVSLDSTLSADHTTGALIGRLLRRHVRPYYGRLALAMTCMGLVAAGTAINAWLIKPVLDEVFLNRNETMLVIVPLAFLIVAIVKGAADYGQAVLSTNVGLRIIADMQGELFAHLMRSDLAFFHDTPTGKLISRFTNDVNLLRAALSNSLAGIAKDSLTVVFLVALMFYQDWRLALAAAFVFPIAVLPIVRIGRRMRGVSANTQVRMGQFATLLTQTFQGARHVKAYGMEEYETGRARGIIEGVFAMTYKAARVRSVARPIMEVLGAIAIASVILYGGSQVIAGKTTPGTFFSFMAAFLFAYQPVKSLANLNAHLQEGLAAAQRVFAMLDLEPHIRDRADARALSITGGAIGFDRVSFSYVPGVPTLKQVSLEVPAGKTVALVGPSGSGKSTILNLIPRFYDVDSGAVTIDGADVREVTLASLRGNIALVSQEVSLFDDTVRANIAYGRFGAGDDEIVAAAKRAAAHEFVASLPEGYDTLVGEHGIKLSGGQRQRITIARAMLKNAPILLLDEATSALDTEAERQVQAALNELMQGRTTLVIAHRLSTVIGADIIYVVDDGRVVEAGSHEDLLAKGGTYARLYALQFADQTARANDAGGPRQERARAARR